MKLHILGSCSGTEPMPGRHHTSLALETGGSLYFLDAGENCGYSSYLLGIDQLRTPQHLHLPHPHGPCRGLAPPAVEPAEAVHPLPGKPGAHGGGGPSTSTCRTWRVFDGVYKMLLGSEGNYETVFSLQPHLVQDGLLQEEGLRVEAFHNLHLGEPAPGERWKSFSFVLAAEGKKLVYSGDFRDFSELLPHLSGADLILLETGHHRLSPSARS